MDRIELGSDADVQLDVFSGRPNPRWALSGDRVKALEERLEDLAPGDEHEPPGLGYRGFIIESGDLRARVFESVISVTRQGRTSFFRDERGLEELLLVQAREHGYSELLAAFRGTDSSQAE